MTVYYRLAGKDAITNRMFGYDTKGLARSLFEALQGRPEQKQAEQGKSAFQGVEIILGVLPSGASYLLAGETQMRTLLSDPRFPSRGCRPWVDNAQYLSYSPIRFQSVEALHEKIKKYAQKNKRGGANMHDTDTSPANKPYNIGQDLSRAAFENQRTLWAAIAGVIDITKFNMPQVPTWLASTSFVALVPDTWLKDDYLKAQSNPTILNVHMASIDCLDLADPRYASKIAHNTTINIRETKIHKNAVNIYKSHKMSEGSDNSETLRAAEVGLRLNEYFASIDSKNAFLLVYDAKQTLAALKKLGVDVSGYNEGIYCLLHGDGTSFKKAEDMDERKPFDRRASGYDSQSRQRSLSPHRRDSLPPRARSPIERKPYTVSNVEAADEERDDDEDEEEDLPARAKIFVVDAKAMFSAMSTLNGRDLRDLRDLGRRLGIRYAEADGPSNACALIIEAWRRMASGSAIDEQYNESWSRVVPSYEATIRPRPQNWERPAEGDYDPNDVDMSQLQTGRSVVRSGASGFRPPVDSSDEDE